MAWQSDQSRIGGSAVLEIAGDLDQAPWVPDRRRPQEHRIHDAEHGGVDTDPDSQGDDRDPRRPAGGPGIEWRSARKRAWKVLSARARHLACRGDAPWIQPITFGPRPRSGRLCPISDGGGFCSRFKPSQSSKTTRCEFPDGVIEFRDGTTRLQPRSTGSRPDCRPKSSWSACIPLTRSGTGY